MNNHSSIYSFGRLLVMIGGSLALCHCGEITAPFQTTELTYPLAAERPMPFSMQAKWEARIGSFTYQEMVAKHGRPISTKVSTDGTFVAKWTGASIDPYEEYLSTDTFVLTFDRNGVLSNWTYYR